jgi:hypothetical protein
MQHCIHGQIGLGDGAGIARLVPAFRCLPRKGRGDLASLAGAVDQKAKIMHRQGSFPEPEAMAQRGSDACVRRLRG